MADYEYQTTTGVIVPDTSTLQTQVQDEYKAVFGQDLDVSPSTPQGVLITAETLARDVVVRNNAALANQINPNLAGGVFLDAIAALTGLTRSAATRSTVSCTLTGVPTTIIPEGVRAQTASGDVFESITTAILDSGGNATATFRSVEFGPVPALMGTLTQIVDGVLGWETITNPVAATLGVVQQSDTSFRDLRNRTLALQGIALPEAITSALYALEGVTSLAFRENVESIPMGMIVSVTGGSTLSDTVWGMTTETGTGTNDMIIVGTDPIAFAETLQSVPSPSPWPTAAFTTTGNITLSGLSTQAGGDWGGTLTGGDIILVKDQTAPEDNGTYTAAAGAWSRIYAENLEEIIGAVFGISLVPHSMYVCVQGGSDTDVATSILANKSLGCNYNGNTVVNVTDPISTQVYAVRFQRPEEVQILVRVTVSYTGTSVDPNTAVPEAVLAYASGQIPGEQGFVVGGDVSPFEIGGAVNNYYPALYVKKVEVAINEVGPVYSTNDIAIGVDQIAVTSDSLISVVVV